MVVEWSALAVGATVWAATAPYPRLLQAIAWSGVGILASFVVMAWPGARRHPAAGVLGAAAAAVVAVLTLKQGVDALRESGGLSVASRTGVVHAAVRASARATATTRVCGVPDQQRAAASRARRGQPLVQRASVVRAASVTASGGAGSRQIRVRVFLTVDGVWEPARWPNPWSRFLPFWRCSRDGSAPRQQREQTCYRTIMERATGVAV